MIRAIRSRSSEASERAALRRRVKLMYERLNRGLWEKCYSLIDPKLKDHSRVELPIYSSTLQAFMKAFGTIKFWHIRVNLHLNAPPNKQDKRPFAYVYVGWQDHAHGFHMFKER